MTASVGEDFESLCRKCGDVWHVVVAMDGSKVIKVQCKQCNGVHRPKALSSAAKAPKTAKAAPVTRGSASAQASNASARKTRVSSKPELIPSNPDKAIQDYSPKLAFELGDTVRHKSFGNGVVQGLPSPGKMDVYFPGHEMKRLVCERAR